VCTAPNADIRWMGTVEVVDDLIDLTAPQVLDDSTIRRALTILAAEQVRRAVAAADPSALVEDGFRRGFDSKGLPHDPWLQAGVLVCPGAKIDRSVMSHVCGFVRIGNHWVWEHPEIIEDSVRHLPGPTSRMQSVSLVPVADGTAVDLIRARTRQGVHELTAVRSFLVEDGVLTLVSQRAVQRLNHRT